MDSMSVVYEGEDIYEEAGVERCWHDMHAWGALDELNISFDDSEGAWGGWAPKVGDSIEVSDGAARSGRMQVFAVCPKATSMDVRAYPVPVSMFESKCRAWESVRLLQLLEQVARDAGMGFEAWGIEDRLYSYVEQRNESDLSFLSRRLTFEGASLVPFDGKLVAYSGQWAEARGAAGTVELPQAADYECDDDATRAYGSCTVTDGTVEATFEAGPGRVLRRVVADRLTDAAEAHRFARGLLREANREAAVMRVRADSLLRDIAAGSVVEVEAEAQPSWNGRAIVAHLRHDYIDSSSKAWLSRTLGGY